MKVFRMLKWDEVRSHAEINLDGTSGRQRVPIACFDDLIIKMPVDIDEQKAIASILSSLDDKIDLLHRQNATLEKVGNRYLLTSDPVPEIEKLYGKKVNLKKMISGTESISDKIPFPKVPIEITLTFNLANKTKMGFPNKYGITLKNSKGEYYTVGYDNIDKCFYADRTRATGENFSSSFPSLHFAPYIVREAEITWRMIIDVSSVELFAADGKAVITDLVFPSDIFDEIELFAENGRIEMIGGTVSELNSIWNK